MMQDLITQERQAGRPCIWSIWEGESQRPCPELPSSRQATQLQAFAVVAQPSAHAAGHCAAPLCHAQDAPEEAQGGAHGLLAVPV